MGGGDEPVSRGARPQWCVVVLTCSADEDDDGGGEDGDVKMVLRRNGSRGASSFIFLPPNGRAM